MKTMLSVLSLLLVLGIIALLAKKQLAAVSAPLPTLDGFPGALPGASAAQSASPKLQTQQLEQAVQGIMQQARPMPEAETPAK